MYGTCNERPSTWTCAGRLDGNLRAQIFVLTHDEDDDFPPAPSAAIAYCLKIWKNGSLKVYYFVTSQISTVLTYASENGMIPVRVSQRGISFINKNKGYAYLVFRRRLVGILAMEIECTTWSGHVVWGYLPTRLDEPGGTRVENFHFNVCVNLNFQISLDNGPNMR